MVIQVDTMSGAQPLAAPRQWLCDTIAEQDGCMNRRAWPPATVNVYMSTTRRAAMVTCPAAKNALNTTLVFHAWRPVALLKLGISAGSQESARITFHILLICLFTSCMHPELHLASRLAACCSCLLRWPAYRTGFPSVHWRNHVTILLLYNLITLLCLVRSGVDRTQHF